MNTISTVRAFCFLATVFQGQQADLFCGKCKAWVNSVSAVREKLAGFESADAAEFQKLPAELAERYRQAKEVLYGLDLPAGLPGQKKAGNCLLPQGVCFVKRSLAILDTD